MVVVTSSAGMTGRFVTKALSTAGQRIRAVIRRAEQEATVREAGAAAVVVADVLDRASIEAAMVDATAVYHICPRMSKDEVAIGTTLIQAAERAGIRHFVFHSAIHSLLEAMPHHWNKLHVERALIESSLHYTILQPTRYMQNTLVEWAAIAERGIYKVPYSPNAVMGLVDLEDVAAVAARVVGNPAHFAATYELAGVDALSAVDEARVLTEMLGRPVIATRVPIDEWRTAVATIRTPSQIEYLLKMFAYYDRHGLRPGNPNVVTWLLGRRPATYRQFLERTVAERPRRAPA